MMHEKMMELEPLLEASGKRNLRSIEITHGSLSGTNGEVSGSREPLPGMGCGRNSVDRITGSPAKGDALGGEYDAGSKMD